MKAALRYFAGAPVARLPGDRILTHQRMPLAPYVERSDAEQGPRGRKITFSHPAPPSAIHDETGAGNAPGGQS